MNCPHSMKIFLPGNTHRTCMSCGNQVPDTESVPTRQQRFEVVEQMEADNELRKRIDALEAELDRAKAVIDELEAQADALNRTRAAENENARVLLDSATAEIDRLRAKARCEDEHEFEDEGTYECEGLDGHADDHHAGSMTWPREVAP